MVSPLKNSKFLKMENTKKIRLPAHKHKRLDLLEGN